MGFHFGELLKLQIHSKNAPVYKRCNLGLSLLMCFLNIDVIFPFKHKWLSDPLITSLQILSQYAAVFEAFFVY